MLVVETVRAKVANVSCEVQCWLQKLSRARLPVQVALINQEQSVYVDLAAEVLAAKHA